MNYPDATGTNSHMSTKAIYLLIMLLVGSFLTAGKRPGEKLILSLHKKYRGKTASTVVFSQKTIRYDSAGKELKTSIWYEKIKFPDKFRIDFDSFPSANRSVFRNDSGFVMRKGKLVSKRADKNELLFLLGGMYFRKADEVIKLLDELKYDLSLVKDTNLNSIDYRIIGVNGGKQIWVETKELRIKRIIVPDAGIDAVIESWVVNGKGWLENRISFYRNGVLIQREDYFDIRFNEPLDEKLFDPYQLTSPGKF
jgi:hypothetical protein